MLAIRTALISVFDKSGLAGFAQGLAQRGVKILSTGGTAAHMAQAGVEVCEISGYTGEEEMLDGRVKTLHPKVFAGILADRDNPGHVDALRSRSADPVDLVVVNFYPFGDAVAQRMEIAEAINLIDIGGPSMVRAAAKNHRHVAVLADPADYGEFLGALEANGGKIAADYALRLAQKAFALTGSYDAMIAAHFPGGGGGQFPEELRLPMRKREVLRYGENPHQQAALYAPDGRPCPLSQLAGPGLSYNNHLDLDAAWRCAQSFRETCCAAIIKHGNPCGIAARDNAADAMRAARDADAQSAFGGVIACTREVDRDAALVAADGFYELICAPKFTTEAIEIIGEKNSLRALAVCGDSFPGLQYRSVLGGMLAQQRDDGTQPRESFKVVTEGAPPSEEEWRDMEFAWKAAQHVKSNAIVVARDLRTVGIGAGQTSRVGSAKIACRMAEALAEAEGSTTDGSVAASDGFLPFPDTLEELAAAGVRTLVQPGGSKKDGDATAAANRLGMKMLFAGVRHFLH